VGCSASTPLCCNTAETALTFDYSISTAVQYQVVENNTSPSIYDSESPAPELQTLRVTVYGRVQNVGFRMFVLEAARGMNVAGYVRNEYHGSVSVVAVDTRDTLERLLMALRRGPVHALVDHVGVDWQPGNPQGLTREFEVRA
jgi:acylphosphatase